MHNKTGFSAVILATVMGAVLALPGTASAHEVVHEKRVIVIHDTDHHDRYRHSDKDRWYVQRHHEAKSRWAPKAHRKEKHHKAAHNKRIYRYEQREYRPVVKHQHDYPRRSNDALRVHIGYDIVL